MADADLHPTALASAVSPAAPPREDYARRRAEAEAQVQRLGRVDTRLSWSRLAAVALAVALGVASYRGAVPALTLALPAVAFVALAITHDRVLQRRRRAATIGALYAAGMARLDDAWAGHGDAGARFAAAVPDHLYAADLDLYGRGGLFELLNTARTPIGQRTLAHWLEAPAPAAEVRARQLAVAELAPRLELREELALAGRALGDNIIREEALSAWARAEVPGLPARLQALRLTLVVLSLGVAATAGLWFAGVWSGWPLLGAVAVTWLAARRFRAAVTAIIAGVEKRTDELTTIASVLAVLEREPFQAPLLRALTDALRVHGQPPSARVARLQRRVAFLDARRNQFMALLLAPFQWSTQLALAIEAWRRSDGPAVGSWMQAVGTLDALIALGAFAYEHPDYQFPDISPDSGAGGPRFEARALGHPLLPAAHRVVNDVALGASPRLIIVSGSNMSGKSTLLRSVGVNAVLALAGAPVCARAMTLSPVQVGATLRVNDSLQEGKSRFYAELTRLKQIVDRAGAEPPLLFLLDEILHGTNSHDRRIGAEAIVRGLVARGAIGLVTTHDLALTEVAERLAGAALNVHFEDHLENGVMTFDYAMKPGVVRKSNALALMRAVGLDVGD